MRSSRLGHYGSYHYIEILRVKFKIPRGIISWCSCYQLNYRAKCSYNSNYQNYCDDSIATRFVVRLVANWWVSVIQRYRKRDRDTKYVDLWSQIFTLMLCISYYHIRLPSYNYCIVQTSTARVVWSYSSVDPRHPSGSDALVHDYKGSRSMNLIGGLPTIDPAPLEGEPFIDIIVDNVSI